MLRIVFMGTPEFAVAPLHSLHSAHSIVGVYTQPDRPVGRGLSIKMSPVKEYATQANLPIFQPEKLSTPEAFETLKSLNPDCIVVVAYGQILKRNVIDLPRLGCVNIHSSLLPRWRGAAPIQWSILAGDLATGITTMRIVEKLDAGDILLQERTTISNDDTAQSIHDRLSLLGAQLILPTLEGLENSSLSGTPQIESQVTYAAKLTKEMEWLNPHETAQTLDRRVRALNPWPGTSLKITNQRLQIKKARAHLNLSGPAGQLFEQFGMLLLGTKQGCLELQTLQWEGKKPVDAGHFLNGLQGRGQTLPLLVDSAL